MEQKKSERIWVGLDMGATKMRAVVFDNGFKPLASAKKKTRGHEGSVVGLDRAAEVIREALKTAQVDPERLTGIGVGCPGPLDLDRGVILDAPNMGWKNVKIKEYLEKAFKVGAFILNDVDAGVYGEYRLGAARGARCAVGVFPGTGIGGGCVYEGELIRGATGSCMEFGHIVVLPEGPVCGCGQSGCLEAVASRMAIAAQAAQAAARGEAPVLRELAGTDISVIRSSLLARSIEGGDVAVEEIVRRAARWVGVGLANVVNLLSPDIIVLGGGLVEAMPRLYLEEVERAARVRCMPAYRKLFRVEIAKLDADAASAGAAAWAQHRLTTKDRA